MSFALALLQALVLALCIAFLIPLYRFAKLFSSKGEKEITLSITPKGERTLTYTVKGIRLYWFIILITALVAYVIGSTATDFYFALFPMK